MYTGMAKNDINLFMSNTKFTLTSETKHDNVRTIYNKQIIIYLKIHTNILLICVTFVYDMHCK